MRALTGAKRNFASRWNKEPSDDPVTPAKPSDLELLRSVYRRLDRDGLAADHPMLNRDDVDDFFRRLAAVLSPERAGKDGHRKIILHVDGGSRGNPGPAGCGVVLLDESGGVIAERSQFIGRATSNEAEYRALILGIETAREYGASAVIIRADSQLLVRQINGRYKVKSSRLKPLFQTVQSALSTFDLWHAEHVPRELNRRADALANEAMDGARN